MSNVMFGHLIQAAMLVNLFITFLFIFYKSNNVTVSIIELGHSTNTLVIIHR